MRCWGCLIVLGLLGCGSDDRSGPSTEGPVAVGDAGGQATIVRDAAPWDGALRDASVGRDAFRPPRDAGPPRVCGNGMVDRREEDCDDGNDDETDGCSNDCMHSYCGDGVVQAGARRLLVYESFEDGFPDTVEFTRIPWRLEPDGFRGGQSAVDHGGPSSGQLRFSFAIDEPGELSFFWQVGQENIRVSIDDEVLLNGATGDWSWTREVASVSAGEHVLVASCDDRSGRVFDVDDCWIDLIRVIAPGTFDEQCDDGNRVDGDGCSATCQSE